MGAPYKFEGRLHKGFMKEAKAARRRQRHQWHFLDKEHNERLCANLDCYEGWTPGTPEPVTPCPHTPRALSQEEMAEVKRSLRKGRKHDT